MGDSVAEGVRWLGPHGFRVRVDGTPIVSQWPSEAIGDAE
jgi:hypothetical protein